MPAKKRPLRQPPVSIPLPFEDAIRAALRVAPVEKPKPKRRKRKKPKPPEGESSKP